MSALADRSVSINLRARVSGFVAGMQTAKKETTDLGRRMTETGASADQMRKRLEAATKALPKIEIDADSTPAEIKFAQLRAELEKLSEKKIGIDIDADAARAQLAEIERELENLQRNEASIDVKADIGTALAELRAVQGEVGRLNGQTANVRVDADVSGALRNIALVGAALASLPAAVTIGAGVAGLGAAFGAAGAGAAAFGAVAIPAFGRVNEAVKEMSKNTGSAGGATKSAGQAAATAAQQALQLEQAERRVSDAKRAAKQAAEDLTRAREEERRAIEDLNLSLKDAALSEEDAALSIREAQERLNEVMSDPKASQLQRERAQLTYDQAVQHLEDQQVRTKRLQDDTEKANKSGVEGSDRVRAAKDKQVKSEQAIIDAQKALQVLILQQKAALQQAGGAAGGAASKFDDLSKAEKAMAKELKGFQDGYVEWQRSLEGDVFPAITGGLNLVESMLPRISPLVKSASGAFVVLEKDAEKALKAPFWGEFLFDLNTQIPTAIVGLGRSMGNIGTGFAGILSAFLPFTPTIVGGVEGATKAFSEWGQNLKASPEFHEFIAFVKENAPEVWGMIKNIAGAGKDIVVALAPLGVGSLSGLSLLAKITSGMSASQIQGVALAVGAIYTAVKVGGAVSTGVDLIGNMGKKIDASGKAADGAKGKLSGFASSMSGLGVKAGIASGGLLILGERFASIAQAADRYAEKTAALGGQNLAAEIAAVSKELDVQKSKIEWAIFGKLHFSDASAEAANKTEALEGKLAELKHQQELEAISAQASGDATATMGGQADNAAGQVGGLNTKFGDLKTSLDTFAGRTDALQAVRNMETAYKDATSALEAANGKLSINATMTDKQRDAVVLARDQFATYLQRVKDGADAQATLSGKTTDSTKTILEQLPKMMDLAGSNKEARAQVLKLAEAYGISREDAIKAASSAKGLKEMLDKIKSKQIKIDADTSAAKKKLEELYDWQLKILGVNQELPEGIAAPKKKPKKKADGGVSFSPFADGGISQVAGSVVRSFAAGSERHVAQIAPAGAMRVWAEPETGGEAYIPLAGAKRARSTEILAAVASEFGMQLMPAGKLALIAMANGGVVAGASTPVFSAGSASGGLSVSIDNLGGMTAALDQVSAGLNQRLAGATGTLIGTLGDGGTLTKTIVSVGGAASKVASATSSATTTLSSATSKLTAAMTKLGAEIGKLTTALGKAGSVAGSPKPPAKTKKPPAKPKARTDPNDVTYDRNPPKKKPSRDPNDATFDRNPPKPKPKNQIGGSSGGGSSSIVGEASYAGASAALRGAAGLFGRSAGREFGAVMAGSASRSLPISGPSGALERRAARRSAPQMGNPSFYSGVASAGAAQPGSLEGRLAREAAGVGARGAKQSPTINIETYVEAPGGSARKTAEELNFLGRRS